MITRQERFLRNAVIILAIAALMLGGLLFISLRAMALLKEDTADKKTTDIATVGKQSVTEQQWIDELKKKHGDEVLIGMLNHMVVDKEAKELGISVTPDDVEQELSLTIDGYESEEQYYAQMLAQLGMTREDVYEETLYRLTLQAIATADITIREADIDYYLEENPERFIPKKEMQLSMILVPTYQEAERVMDRLDEGENFANLAKELSTDEESRQLGGSLGRVEEDNPFWPEGLLKAATSLETGDIAGPIQVEDSFAIIQLESTYSPKVPDDKEIRNLVRQELALEQAPSLQQVESDLRAKYDASIYIDNKH